MEIKNLLPIHTRQELRAWFLENSAREKECWVLVNRSKTPSNHAIAYLDVVEEALCFAWIDSTCKKTADGKIVQRLTPRKPNSPWTELNKERVRRLAKLGLMTEAGYAVLPDMNPEHFKIDPVIKHWLQNNPDAYANFKNFPPLYQRVRINTLQKKKQQPDIFQIRFAKFKENTKKNIMYGNWNDNGRLLDY